MGADITVLWSAKGGSGTTVTTAAAAIHEPRRVCVVDLCGDMVDVAVTAWPKRGLSDWFDQPGTCDDLDDLDALVIGLDRTTFLLPTRTPVDLRTADIQRTRVLLRWMSQQSSVVLVDAGTGLPPARLLDAADRNLLVTRSSYLAVMKAVRCGLRPDGIVLINDAGRTLDKGAIERAVGAPVVTEIDIHPSVARTVDAGMLSGGHAHFRRSTAVITRPDRPPTALTSWRAENPARHSPDIDFGVGWRSAATPGSCRVSWNTGSGDLYATTMEEDRVELLGSFTTELAVRKALVGWQTRHAERNGLDWMRTQTGAASRPTPNIDGPALA